MAYNKNIIEITFPNGDKYSGESKEGKMHGRGILALSNGDKYVGEFKDNKFHGQGTYSFSRTFHTFDEGEYSGTFKDGLRDGIGFLKFRKSSSYLNQDYESEVQYVGNIEKYSEKENYLTYNETYIGAFKDNVFSGKEIKYGLDVLSWDNHSIYAIGLWKDDNFLAPASKSHTTEIKYPDHSEWDNFAEAEEQEKPDTKKESKKEDKKEGHVQDTQNQHSMVEFSVPDMIDDEDVIARLKQIPGLEITSHKPPMGYIFPVTGEDIEFKFKNYNFSAETYPDYYLWTFYVDSKCPQDILLKFISHLQKAK
jgi:hypothetical protein